MVRTFVRDEPKEEPERKTKKGASEEKVAPQTPPKVSKKEKKEKVNDKIKEKKLQKSLKIKNREKTPRKGKAQAPQDEPEARDVEAEEEEDDSSSMYQKSPSQEGGFIRKSSPNKSFSFQGTPNKDQAGAQSPIKNSPLKSPGRSPMKGVGAAQARYEHLASVEDLAIVNNIFLSNLSPPSQKQGHVVSTMPGKKAPKKFSPQKPKEDSKAMAEETVVEASPKAKRGGDSPASKQKSNGKSDKSEMVLEVVGKTAGSGSKKDSKSPIKEASSSSPSKKRLQFNDPLELEILREAIEGEKSTSGKSSREKGQSPSKSPNKGSQDKQKKSPKHGSKAAKGEMDEESLDQEGQEEEGIDLLELINISLSQQHAALQALGQNDEVNPEDLVDGLDMLDVGDCPAYMLFEDEEDRKNYFEELNSRYFEDIDQGKTTPKKTGVEYKTVVFGKRNKIKKFFKEDRTDSFMNLPLEIQKFK